MICRHCAATTHEGHAKVTVVEKARQIRERDLSTTQQRLTNIINDYNRTATRLMEIRDDDLETRDTYQREIHDVFQQVIFQKKSCFMSCNVIVDARFNN